MDRRFATLVELLRPTILMKNLPSRASIVLDLVLIFILTGVLIAPWFRTSYTNNWGSIESTFIADARFLMDHWPHPQWQPLWYTGTRFDYVYPPALRYGTAGIAKVLGILPVQAYRFYTGLFYCLGIAGVYLLIRVGSRSRGAAWTGAAGAALTSPAFLFLKSLRMDSRHWMPQRLHVLETYGEGPHMTALALIPFALAFAWIALEGRRWGALACAAIFSAAVVANNFYGATALAIFYPILVFSLLVTQGGWPMLGRVLAIPIFAYGLCAFWLTPSYVRITRQNMQFVSQPGNAWSAGLVALVAVVFAAVVWKLARAKAERAWVIFCSGCGVALTLLVAGGYLFNLRVVGEPVRLVPELDLAYILLGVTFAAWLWTRHNRFARPVATLLVAGALATSSSFVRHAWDQPVSFPDYQKRVEYQIPDWLWKNMPDARVYPDGSVRFWFDTWHDLAQMTGGSDQGLLNESPQYAAWEIRAGTQTEPAILWMQALGVDAVYASDPRSEEIYKNIKPEKFSGISPALYDDQRGNYLYGIPRRYSARARVVDAARLDVLQDPKGDHAVERLRAYVDVVEHGPDHPVTLLRESTDAMTLWASLEPGQSILVQESYDPAWQASAGGTLVPIRRDVMGFMVLDLPPGQQEVHLRFATPLENTIGRIITLLTALVLLAGGIKNRAAFQRVRA